VAEHLLRQHTDQNKIRGALGVTKMNLITNYRNIRLTTPRGIYGVVVLFMVISIGQAFAQQPDRKSAAYMWSPEMQKRLYALGLYLDKNALGKTEPCNGKVWLEPISIGVLQPLVFSVEDAHPIKGAWTIRYRFDRCGESITYNALFQANEQGPTTVFHLPPGTTKTSPRLLRDLNPGVFMAANAHNGDNKQCKLVAVTNTTVTAEPASLKVGNETFEGVWEENWTIRTCSGTFSMAFCFIPEKSGGTTWISSKCNSAQIATARALNAHK
jgi:hypothetical protein